MYFVREKNDSTKAESCGAPKDWLLGEMIEGTRRVRDKLIKPSHKEKTFGMAWIKLLFLDELLGVGCWFSNPNKQAPWMGWGGRIGGLDGWQNDWVEREGNACD